MSNNNSSILIDVELPVKCSPEEFNYFYNERYKKIITHQYIIDTLKISKDTKLKLNGTFKRKLYLLDDKDNLYGVIFKVQTVLYDDSETGKTRYVSIMPSFIKKYCSFSLTTLEYIATKTKEGDSVFNHIDDPLSILECEHKIIKSLKRIEIYAHIHKYSSLLNSKYTETYNRPLEIVDCEVIPKRFKVIYELIIVARAYFGVKYGVLSLTNKLIIF